MASRRATGAKVSPKFYTFYLTVPLSNKVSFIPHNLTILPLFVLKPYLVLMTFTSLRGSTKVQTWFLSKFSNSSYMALMQLKSERACPTSRGSKRGNKECIRKAGEMS
jgi:hypothetical protein